jgi:gamma-glutamyl:cysteine ligase YbdK (ATP-grasp superfamily)
MSAMSAAHDGAATQFASSRTLMSSSAPGIGELWHNQLPIPAVSVRA